MNRQILNWKNISSLEQLEKVIDDTRIKPALVFVHRPSSPESKIKKEELETEWSISSDLLNTYIVDEMKSKEVSQKIADIAGIIHYFPQIVLFADGVTMYDESNEMISVKKIKLALKIVNRTFKWMESKV